MKTYDKFEDWFHELESYGYRSERFYDEILMMTPERAVEWLRAAWDSARIKDETRTRS